MIAAENTFAGLTILQIALASLGLLIITMNVWSGWQNGVVRQVLRVAAILIAYLVGYKIGPLVGLIIPDISVLGSAQNAIVSILTGLATYLILRLVVNILFRKTREQESFLVRLVYGAGGAFIGLLFSVVFLVALLSGIRLLGTVADAQFRVAKERRTPLPNDSRTVVMSQFSKAREAVTNGPLAPVVETIDPTPADLYRTLDKIATVSSDPDAMGRFMDFRGTRKLMEDPLLKGLADDPAIQTLAGNKKYFTLMQNPKVFRALEDENLRGKLKSFELMKALDFALKKEPAAPTLPTPTPPETRVY